MDVCTVSYLTQIAVSTHFFGARVTFPKGITVSITEPYTNQICKYDHRGTNGNLNQHKTRKDDYNAIRTTRGCKRRDGEYTGDISSTKNKKKVKLFMKQNKT